MQISISLRDGALGYSADQSNGLLAFIGVCSGGTANTLVPITDPKQAADAFVSGKLVDRIAFHLANGGSSPCYAMKAAATNAGTMPNYQVQASATLAGNNAGNAFGSLVNPTTPRNIEVVFGAGYDGGNVTINGTDAAGNSISEVITAAAGATVKGNRVFKTITSASKGAVGASAATAQLFHGNKSVEGTSACNGQVASTGSAPLDDMEIVLRITRDGDVASGAPAFKWSVDGGETFSGETAIPAGGTYSGLASSHGLTFVFSGTTLKTGTEFRFSSTGPTMATADLSAALAALHADPTEWEGLHVMGALTGAQAAVVEAWHGTCRAAGRYAWTISETRDQSAGETIAARQTSIKADYASVTSTYGQLAAVDPYIETVIPAKGVFRRSGAWAAATQISRVPLSVHPGSPSEAGPLRGVYKPADGAGLYHDERINPGMGGSLGRFLTLQTLLGRRGQFFVGDAAGLRSPGTLAGGSSDYGLHMNVRVIMYTARIMQQAATNILARRLATKQNGTLLESEAKKLDEELTWWLRVYLVQAGHCVVAYALVSRSHNVQSTKQVPFQVFVRPWGYALDIPLSLGFEKVLV